MGAYLLGLITIIPLIWCTDHSPLFHNGRPRNGFLGNPQVDPKLNLKAAEPQWFTQKLNHFDSSENRTWQQRYYVNASMLGMNGPVFLMIGGEGPLSASWVAMGAMVEYAQRNKALVLAVEHRFYGESHPTDDLSVDNLRYLSSEQALADVATFREGMVKQFSLSDKNKWIVFGGSYPGALAAWFRYKYPHLAHGAIASSAPILAQLNFPQYLEVSTRSLTDDTCRKNVGNATKTLELYTQTEAGRKELTDLFSLCEPLSDNEDDIAQFTSTIAGNFFGVIQYNRDNREFEGAVGTNITVDTLCNMMSIEVLGDILHRYARINTLIMQTYQQKCVSTNYKAFIKDMQSTSWSSSIAEGGRQWTYQTCTEFGFYQSSDSKEQVYGTMFPLNFWTKQCKDIFGANFNEARISSGVEWTNDNYGGYGMSIDKIIFPNGSIDPWHALSFTENVGDMIAIFINGTAHCANMYPTSPNDSKQLLNARIQINYHIGQWLEASNDASSRFVVL